MKPIRNPDSAAGDWYIDTACIDCGASRHVAPSLIVARNGKSVFARQPDIAEDGLPLGARCSCVRPHPYAAKRSSRGRKR